MEWAGIIFGIIYIAGIWKFWAGYDRTSFERGILTRLSLSLLWLPLLVVSKNYRRNFTKALKG
jgi:hypothetical protein